MPPVVGHARAADKTNFAVNHYQLAVRAVVGARPVVPAQRMKPSHVAASFSKLGKKLLRHGETAHSVNHKVHFNASTRPLCQRGHHTLGNLTFGENVSHPI